MYGHPDFGWAGVIWNFEDKTGHFNKIVSQLYFRQAMPMLEDEPAIIAGIFHGAGGARLRPSPVGPEDPVRAEQFGRARRPVQPGQGSAILKAHGWHVVPNGQTTCANPGSGSDQCRRRDP